MTRKQQRKQRISKLQAFQAQQALLNRQHLDRKMAEGAISQLGRLLSANHLLISASQFIVDEIYDFMKFHEMDPKGFQKQFTNVLQANTDFFKLFARLTPEDKVQDWADDLQNFMTVYATFVEFNPFGTNIKINNNDMAYQISIAYNKLRLSFGSNSFTLTELRARAAEADVPHRTKLIPELRTHNFIISDGRRFRFANHPIPLDFINKTLNLPA